jgi:hypothetical protein
VSAAGCAAAPCNPRDLLLPHAANPQPPTVSVGGCGAIRGVPTRIVAGRARVVREVRAAAPLTAALRAPVTAQGPWLTAVLNEGAARRPRARPVAVVVEPHAQGRPEAVAFLTMRRRGPVSTVTLLGDGTMPVPGGLPPFRLLARDEASADRLADGILELMATLRGPRALRLSGLPLGDPTLRALAARVPSAVVANSRSSRLVDELDDAGPVARSRDPRMLERWLPALLEREPDRRARGFLRRPRGSAHPRRRRHPVAVVGEQRRRRTAHRAGSATGAVDGGLPWTTACRGQRSPYRSTLTPAPASVPVVSARSSPSRSAPSAATQPSPGRPAVSTVTTTA